VVLRGEISRLASLAEKITSTEARAEKVRPVAPSSNGRKQAQRRLSLESQAVVVSEYEAGATIQALAAEHRVYRTTVTAILQRAGVPLRRRGLSPHQAVEAVQLYSEGWSTAELGRRYGVDDMTVRRRLLAAGVGMRRPGRPRKQH
jgi:DNA-directed RNA polymerase specialized sigma24 family protein